MKKRLTNHQKSKTWRGTLLSLTLLLCGVANAQFINQTWVAGAEHPYNWGTYGTKGVADAANSPGGRYGSAEWTTSDGVIWLFGGNGPYDGDCCGFGGRFNDLWKFQNGQWTWVSGSNTAEISGVYGTKGVADPANVPGSRMEASSWVDASNNLWLFGGSAYDEAGNSGYLNDLWKFDGTNWTWMGGSKTVNPTAVYGTKGVAAAANVPGARMEALSFTDASGNFWLFGGYGTDVNGQNGLLNDLWKFDGTNWTWVSGDNVKDAAGSYGTQGNWSASNMPGSRSGTSGWFDSNWNYLYLFGGGGYDQNGSSGFLNDLWAYDLGSNQWMWMNGSSVKNASGVYGTKGTANAANVPGARYYASAVADTNGNMYLFGGFGKDQVGTSNYLNDLWKLTADGTWTWVSGSELVNATNMLGIKNVASYQNNIGARQHSSMWLQNNLLMIFGGNSYGSGNINDMWMVNFSGTIPQNMIFKMRISANYNYLTETSNTDRRCQLAADNGGDEQLWYLQSSSTDGRVIVKNLKTNAYLAVSPTPDVFGKDKNGGDVVAYPMVMVDDVTGFNSVNYEASVKKSGSTYSLNYGSVSIFRMTAENTSAGADIYQSYDLIAGYSNSWMIEPVTDQFIIRSNSMWSNSTGPQTSTDRVLITEAYSPTVNNTTAGDVKITKNGSLTLPAGAHLSVYGDLDIMGSLTINSGGSLAMKGDTPHVSGVATVKRKTTGNAGYSIVGSPITDAALADLSADHLYSYNATNQSWTVPTGTMTPGKGYFAAFNETAPEISFAGKLNSSIIYAQVSTAGDGFNLVANPFSAAMTISSFLADANMQNLTTGTVYLWDDGGANAGSSRGGDYVTVNQVGVAVNALADGVSGTKGAAPANRGYIGSMQGFFVEATGNGLLTFDPAYLPSGNAATANTNADAGYYRTSERQLIRLSLSGNGHYNEILVGLDENATLGQDYGLDARKRTVNPDFNFYSRLNEEKFIIQGLPQATDRPLEILMGVDLTTTSNYTLKVEDFLGMDHWTVLLTDLKTNDSWELNAGSALNFNQSAGNDNNRWKLTLVPTQILSAENELTKIQLIDKDDQLTLRYQGAALEQVSIYTLDGRMVFQKEVQFANHEAQIAPVIAKNQVYILNINGETIKFIRK